MHKWLIDLCHAYDLVWLGPLVVVSIVVLVLCKRGKRRAVFAVEGAAAIIGRSTRQRQNDWTAANHQGTARAVLQQCSAIQTDRTRLVWTEL